MYAPWVGWAGTIGCVDEVLQESMEPVLRDLRGAGISAPRVEDDDWTGDPDFPSVMLWSPDGYGFGVSVSRSALASARVAAVADQVQEWAIEELWGHGSNWPPCPQHPNSHPMQATTRDDAAVWVCPTDQTIVSPIGAL